MRIHLKPAGIIRRYVAEKEMELPAGLTIRGFIALLAVPPELKLMVFDHGKRKDLDETLEDGSEIRLITLLSGG